MSVLPAARWNHLQNEIAQSVRPFGETERWLADEIAYAAWELERVRENKDVADAEDRLNAAYSRASRNWARARRELASAQSARTSHLTRLTPAGRKAAAVTPMADAARIPRPTPAAGMVEHALELVQAGVPYSRVLGVLSEQEAR